MPQKLRNPDHRQIHLSLTARVMAALAAYAVLEGVSRQTLVERFVEEGLLREGHLVPQRVA